MANRRNHRKASTRIRTPSLLERAAKVPNPAERTEHPTRKRTRKRRERMRILWIPTKKRNARLPQFVPQSTG